MGSEAPSWADQWGSGGMYDDNVKHEGKESSSNSKGKKMANMKAAASAGVDKAKSAAVVGAQKVKSGTSTGITWIKNKYQKRSSK